MSIARLEPSVNDETQRGNLAREEEDEEGQQEGSEREVPYSHVSDGTDNEDYTGDVTGGEESDYEEGSEVEQENLLSFSAFPLEAIGGQHVMVITAFRRFVAVGTSRGDVMLLEATSGVVFRLLHAHTNPISDITCDTSEKYIGSSDMSGLVTIHNLTSGTESYRKDFGRSIKSLSIHPFYGRRDERPAVVSSSDDVMLITKTMFLGRNVSVIHQKHGKVFCVKWCGADIIAWASETGVVLYSYSGKEVLQSIPRPENSLHLELYNCSLIWEPPRTLTCGWGNWIQEVVLRVSGRESGSRNQRVIVHPPVLTDTLRDPFRVCGMAAFGADRYAVLAATVEQEGCVGELGVRIVDRATFDPVYCARIATSHKHTLQFCLAFTQASCESAFEAPKLTMNNTPQHDPALPTKGSMYFVGCGDVIIRAAPADEDDHVQYLLGVGQVPEAYEYAQKYALTRYDLKGIGWRMLQHLLAVGKHEEAAFHLPRIIQYDCTEWETWIVKFDQRGLSHLLADVVPTKLPGNGSQSGCARETGNPSERIGEEYYELLLQRCLEKDVARFRKAVRRLSGLYKLEVICRAAEVRYNDWRLQVHRGSNVPEEEMRDLGDAYGMLLKLNGQYNEALRVLSRVAHSNELFELVQERHLFSEALELLPELFATNEGKTVELLLTPAPISSSTTTSSNAPATLTEDENDIDDHCLGPPLLFPPASVVQRLEFAHRGYLWSYLKALKMHDKAAYKEILRVYVQLVATLFIENEPSGMLQFLRENYSMLPKLKEIYALCKKEQMLDEMVFLLLRMGKEEEGLYVIVHEMKNMRKAVQFVADVPNKEDQTSLYKKLIHMVLEANAGFPSRNGQKYIEHEMKADETLSSIARRYGVDESDLRAANPVLDAEGGGGCSGNVSDLGDVVPQRRTCIVPLDLTKELIEAVVDMSVAHLVTLDPSLIIELLPDEEPMPHVGNCLATVARSKANSVALMEAVVCVATSDLLTCFESFYKRELSCIRVTHDGAVCPLCRRPTSEGVVVFRCLHAHHLRCVVNYFSGDNTLFDSLSNDEVERILKDPDGFINSTQWSGPISCCFCNQLTRVAELVEVEMQSA
ncbi:vacuolar assembly protein vps41, putative [Trypanosoma brucei gambiense DAL972]|uniref:Vacuolar assembly protein vps41, putative n=1 Tax=Trypanosoma brucei gambiense (strain MHOM/CI/86/DAL972) TaxID=679716 RepID=C9ZQU6_TRYB9|nr:vacuolar assembly protein vps41, putative [Trypanosoma brucei gambiense DAL972]CBH11776.1 vacuolar assembly protein vps41, putative [Trypanosoma brucei gambiense DAL972]|eukprot:XP_011774061.1 vacuolar assembly protein vps41, putative [Trypanosoma brucei gambiense DAL972]